MVPLGNDPEATVRAVFPTYDDHRVGKILALGIWFAGAHKVDLTALQVRENEAGKPELHYPDLATWTVTFVPPGQLSQDDRMTDAWVAEHFGTYQDWKEAHQERPS